MTTFPAVGRRLALLNAAVVVLVIAVVGLSTFALLRRSLDREADRALAERVEAGATAWIDLFVTGRPLPTATTVARPATAGEQEEGEENEAGDVEEDHAEDEDEEADELIESGDTLLYAFDAAGGLLVNARGATIAGLPARAGVEAALEGGDDTRSIRLHGQTVRVYTAPVVRDGTIIGAVQAARGQGEHEAELRLVALSSLAGIGLGSLVAVPAGLFLARRAMRPIDAAFNRQRAFVADASHELRTPLTLVRANAELLTRLPETPPATRAEVTAILAEIDDMSRLIDDLLLLARSDDAALALARHPTDLAALARTTTEAMAGPAGAKGLTLTVAADHPVVAAVDADRVRQVLRILLDNAIAYTPAGGTISVSVTAKPRAATVAVRDTGIGIGPAEQGRVFDRFYRADRARSRATGGTGLGLPIARALVAAHGGDIGLESAPGQGTTVWFTLPLG